MMRYVKFFKTWASSGPILKEKFMPKPTKYEKVKAALVRSGRPAGVAHKVATKAHGAKKK